MESVVPNSAEPDPKKGPNWNLLFEIFFANWRKSSNADLYLAKLTSNDEARATKTEKTYFAYVECLFRFGWGVKPDLKIDFSRVMDLAVPIPSPAKPDQPSSGGTPTSEKTPIPQGTVPYADGMGPDLYREGWDALLDWCNHNGRWKDWERFRWDGLDEALRSKRRSAPPMASAPLPIMTMEAVATRHLHFRLPTARHTFRVAGLALALVMLLGAGARAVTIGGLLAPALVVTKQVTPCNGSASIASFQCDGASSTAFLIRISLDNPRIGSTVRGIRIADTPPENTSGGRYKATVHANAGSFQAVAQLSQAGDGFEYNYVRGSTRIYRSDTDRYGIAVPDVGTGSALFYGYPIGSLPSDRLGEPGSNRIWLSYLVDTAPIGANLANINLTVTTANKSRGTGSTDCATSQGWMSAKIGDVLVIQTTVLNLTPDPQTLQVKAKLPKYANTALAPIIFVQSNDGFKSVPACISLPHPAYLKYVPGSTAISIFGGPVAVAPDLGGQSPLLNWQGISVTLSPGYPAREVLEFKVQVSDYP